jgi:hypothetical protein
MPRPEAGQGDPDSERLHGVEAAAHGRPDVERHLGQFDDQT